MFEIVICDDDNSVLEQTRQLIDNWADSISVPVTVKTTDNGDMLLSYCSRSNPDVIILDIMMPFLNGMDAAKEILILIFFIFLAGALHMYRLPLFYSGCYCSHASLTLRCQAMRHSVNY